MQRFDRILKNSSGAALVEAALIFAFILIVIIGGGFYYFHLFRGINNHANAFDALAMVSGSGPMGVLEMTDGQTHIVDNAGTIIEDFAEVLKGMADSSGFETTACVGVYRSHCGSPIPPALLVYTSSGQLAACAVVANELQTKVHEMSLAACGRGGKYYWAAALLGPEDEFFGASTVGPLMFAEEREEAGPPPSSPTPTLPAPTATPTDPGGGPPCAGLGEGVACGMCCSSQTTSTMEDCCQGCCDTGTDFDPGCYNTCWGWSNL